MEIAIFIGIVFVLFVIYQSNRGTICYKCSSNYIRHQGWSERSDKRRIHSCNQCGAYLYRRYGKNFN